MTNFLTKNQLSIPNWKNIYSEKEYNNRLPKNIDSLISDVKNKLVYDLKDWEWNFWLVYNKNWLVFKELLWTWNYHDHWSEIRKLSLEDWLTEINDSWMLEFEVLKYIKKCNIWVNTPEPVMYLNRKNIDAYINVIERKILLLKAFIKDRKHHDYINLLWLNQIIFQLTNWLNTIAFAMYKKHFKKKLLNLINIKTITRPVIIMEEMKWKPIEDNYENKILFDRYKEYSKKLEDIWIHHDSHYWNILYDEKSDEINLIDFWAVHFTDNIKKIIEKDTKQFMIKYPHIFMTVHPLFWTKKYRKRLLWI